MLSHDNLVWSSRTMCQLAGTSEVSYFNNTMTMNWLGFINRRMSS